VRRWVAAGRRDSIALARAAMEAASPSGLRPMATIRRALGSEMYDFPTRPCSLGPGCEALHTATKNAWNKK
jgi:hypothetical protein